MTTNERGMLCGAEYGEIRKKMTGGRANDTQVGGEHYQTAKVQHWDFVHMHSIPYMEAQIIKYVMRHRKKNGLEDLRKALHFTTKLIEQEYGDE